MNNYKIRVNNEAESREAQGLFKQLGFKLVECHRVGIVAVNDGEIYPDVIGNWDEYEGEELTLLQLRDLVVLHRNDYTDATHVDQDGWKWFISSDNNSYVFGAANSQGLPRWNESPLDHVDLTPIQKPQKIQEQGLISGADALRALADGKEIEYINTYGQWDEAAIAIPAMDILDDKFKFRLKPRTVKLEIKVPAPFEPKYGEEYWFLCLNVKDRYASTENQNLTCDRYRIDFGVYRTEAEIKIVVEQLSKLKEHSK